MTSNTSNSSQPKHHADNFSASAHKGDQLWSSLASSSALVSETVLDPWPVERKIQISSSPLTPSQTRDDAERRSFANSVINDRVSPSNDDESKGVNHHNYSPESLRRILEEQHRERIIEAQSPHRSDERCCDDHVPNIVPASNMLVGAASFVSRWVQVQKIKRQKEALEKAVEEQRRILLRQTLCTERKRKGVRSTKKLKDEYADLGLDSNETFQNLTKVRTKRTVSALSFCGAGSSSYVDDEDYDSTFDEESLHGANESLSEQNLKNSDALTYGTEDDSAVSYDSCSHQDEGTFMIGNPCHTVSGQGMAVQLQILEKPEKKAKPKSDFYGDGGKVNIIHERSSVPFILSPAQMKEIAIHGLPTSIMFNRWKRLYCLQRDGDSFDSSFLKKVSGETRTLLVIETTNHEKMGGYSNSIWENQSGSVGAAFYGSCQASLFKINRDNSVEVFKWSGRNRYVQVCDVHAKLLAFGGGGKDGAFGLCIEDDFAVGTTGRCETFNNDPLCDEGRFEILNVECWGFMPDF